MEHDWLPLLPERVVEVGFDQVDGDRFRHPARFLRWRPDRTADSCTVDQILAAPSRSAERDLVAGGSPR
jgi:ATP-dependent DNA ligase